MFLGSFLETFLVEFSLGFYSGFGACLAKPNAGPQSMAQQCVSHSHVLSMTHAHHTSC